MRQRVSVIEIKQFNSNKISMYDGLQKPCQQRDDYKNMKYVYKWILHREV